MLQATSPCLNRRDGVGRSGFIFLVLAIVACDRAVCCFRFDNLSVRRHQLRGHHPERAEALSHDIGLHVAIVVLARPHKAAVPFQRAGNHVINQSMLVPDAPPLYRHPRIQHQTPLGRSLGNAHHVA